MLDGEHDDVHTVDGDGGEPEDPAEAESDLKIKTAQDHQYHAEGAVKACRNGLVILFPEGSEIHGDLEDVADHKDGPAGHDQVAEPDKSESAVNISECQETQKCRDDRYRYFFQSFHTFLSCRSQGGNTCFASV